jgi:ankyrin repeat protein
MILSTAGSTAFHQAATQYFWPSDDDLSTLEVNLNSPDISKELHDELFQYTNGKWTVVLSERDLRIRDIHISKFKMTRKDTSNHCRKINAMMQTNQPLWKEMKKLRSLQCKSRFGIEQTSIDSRKEKIKENIFLILDHYVGLNCSDEGSDPFPPGPVGDNPIHDCFLLGLHDLGKQIIARYYGTSHLISVPYRNDLLPWRKTTDEIQQICNSSTQTWENGLYTGETILHIAIVQEEVEVVRYLLENGIEISSRATGVFFQPRFRSSRRTDLSFTQSLVAYIAGINLDREECIAMNQIENVYSGCYYGEYPLSFAASVGNVEICNLLYEYCWKRRSLKPVSGRDPTDSNSEERSTTFSEKNEMENIFENRSIAKLNHYNSFMEEDEDVLSDDDCAQITRTEKLMMWKFVNAADNMGNTAMHIAVIHNRKGIIDWLMSKEEGRHGLDLLNNDGFTPLTLAARFGRVEIFHHILYKHMSQIAWTYGRVCCCTAYISHADSPFNTFSLNRCGCFEQTFYRWIRLEWLMISPVLTRKGNGEAR